jgi:hypothetical protein
MSKCSFRLNQVYDYESTFPQCQRNTKLVPSSPESKQTRIKGRPSSHLLRLLSSTNTSSSSITTFASQTVNNFFANTHQFNLTSDSLITSRFLSAPLKFLVLFNSTLPSTRCSTPLGPFFSSPRWSAPLWPSYLPPGALIITARSVAPIMVQHHPRRLKPAGVSRPFQVMATASALVTFVSLPQQ